jgi:hypothetical protein
MSAFYPASLHLYGWGQRGQVFVDGDARELSERVCNFLRHARPVPQLLLALAIDSATASADFCRLNSSFDRDLARSRAQHAASAASKYEADLMRSAVRADKPMPGLWP